jgi:hypothetical protein
MAHRVQDARGEHPVPAGLGEREGLNEIALRKRARGRAVVAHPRSQKHGLAYRSEQRAPHVAVVLAMEHPVGVGAEVLDQRRPRVPSAELVIKPGEHVDGDPEAVHV